MDSELIESCKVGNIEQVQQLSDSGMDPKQANKNGENPLYEVTCNNCTEIVELLLKAGRI